MKPQKRTYIALKNRADASLTCKPCFFTHATTVPSLVVCWSEWLQGWCRGWKKFCRGTPRLSDLRDPGLMARKHEGFLVLKSRSRSQVFPLGAEFLEICHFGQLLLGCLTETLSKLKLGAQLPMSPPKATRETSGGCAVPWLEQCLGFKV